ncbi:MAG: hypothetical protein L3J91_02085 [Thermoplasmata archaeon]|nr:hypothetical protein [Thermoplasmata archaeon]
MEPIDWGLLLLILGAVGLALYAGPNVGLAQPAAAAALAFTALWAIVALLPRLRWSRGWTAPAGFDRLSLLTDALEQGQLGRQTVLSTIASLESEVLGSRGLTLTLDQEIQLARSPPAVFRAWVDARLTELEKAS